VSNWHRFVRTPGRVSDGDTGDVACDHYRRWQDDITLMRELRLNAYRFSIAWSRVLPQGTGRLNSRGLAFYERLVDGLLAQGIQPMATLFHWDLPAALDDRGGWLNPDAPAWFAEYAQKVFRRLDDRVTLWATLNEPWVVTDGGYLHGALAPGHRSRFEAPIAAHHLMLAHGAAVQAYRALGRHRIGLVVNIEPKYPASSSEADLAAARRAHAYMNRQFLDPAIHGSYPEEMREIFGEAWPDWPASDLVRIRQPIDFIGLNYYTRSVVRFDAQNWPLRAATVHQPQSTYTQTGWEVFPQGLTDTLLWLGKRYGNPPLYITENGAAFYDPPDAGPPPVVPDGHSAIQPMMGMPPTVAVSDAAHAPAQAVSGRTIGASTPGMSAAVPGGERIDDPLRVDYLRAHLRATREAIERGVDVRGYFAWSLLDNFEWALGYSRRFGLVHVNYATQQRTPKTSARFYASVIDTSGTSLEP